LALSTRFVGNDERIGSDVKLLRLFENWIRVLRIRRSSAK
jgi:hypothetical protein